MARLLTSSIRSALLTATVIGALCSHTSAQAADAGLWSEVQKAGVLRCGAAVLPPYVMRDPATGKYSGYFAELCRDFGERILKVKVEFVDTTWDNQVAGLQSGKWDLSIALNQTPERALAVAFSAPATTYEISFLSNKDNPKLANAGDSFEDYDKPDINIGVMVGSAMDKAVSPKLKNAKIVRLPGVNETRLALMSRRVDVLADASDTNHLFALANPSWAKEVFPKPALAKQGVSFAARRDISAADLDVLNIYISQRRDSGEISTLVDEASQQVNAGQASR